VANDRIEFTATGRYYKVYRNGEFVSQHTTEREASQKAANELLQDNAAAVHYTHDYVVEAEFVAGDEPEPPDSSLVIPVPTRVRNTAVTPGAAALTITNHIIVPRMTPPATAASTIVLDAASYEGTENTTTQFSATRTNGYSHRVSVDWTLTGAAATPAAGTITFPVGEGQQTVVVELGEVTVDKGGFLALTNPQNLDGGPTPVFGDPYYTNFTTYNEPEVTDIYLNLGSSGYSGTEDTLISFAVNRTGALGTTAVSVDWAITGVTTTPSSGTVTFAADDSQQPVEVAAGLVTGTTAGTLTLSNSQNLSGDANTVSLSAPLTASFTVVDVGITISTIPDITLSVDGTHDMSQYISNPQSEAITTSMTGLDLSKATYDSGTMELRGVAATTTPLTGVELLVSTDAFWTLPAGTQAKADTGLFVHNFNSTTSEVEHRGLSVYWADLNPAEGVYDWTSITDKLNGSLGDYQIVLLIKTNVADKNGIWGAGQSIPQWVLDKHSPALAYMKYDDASNYIQVAAPWDTGLQAELSAFITAFGAQGIHNHANFLGAYVHGISTSYGEEFWMDAAAVASLEAAGMTPALLQSSFTDRLNWWATAVGAQVGKLGWVKAEWFQTNASANHAAYQLVGPVLDDLAYTLGMGTRWGNSEKYWGRNNEDGQSYDADGYLETDYTNLILAEQRFFANENEYNGSSQPDEAYEYRMACLRTLAMGQRLMWVEDRRVALDPTISEYYTLIAGKTAAESPDAWSVQIEADRDNSPTLKNFERFLYQREAAGSVTTRSLPVTRSVHSHDAGSPVDWTARTTNVASGNDRITFTVDQAFLPVGSGATVDLKVEWLDDGASWKVLYSTPTGTAEAGPFAGINDTNLKTREVALSNFDTTQNLTGGFDFALVATQGDLTVSAARILREVGTAAQSVVAGILNLASGQGGSAQLHFEWTRPTTSTDASVLRDLRSFKIYVGTSSGNYNVLGTDTFGTGQKGATECIVTGLNTGVTYYCTASAIDAFGNESAKATEQSFVAAIPSTPSRSYTDITGTTTISGPGDYRLTASFAGKVTIDSSDVYLYGNGQTITFDADHGIEIDYGTQDNVEIDGVSFTATGGAGANIRVLGNLTNSKIHDCGFESRNPGTAAIDASGGMSGTRVYSNTLSIDTGTTVGTARDAVMGRSCNGPNLKFFNNTITCVNAARDGGYADCQDVDIFADTCTFSAPCGQATYISNYKHGGVYIHDCNIDASAITTGRVIHFDGSQDYLILHNTIDVGTGMRGIGFRGAGGDAVDDASVGYNIIRAGGRSIGAGIRFGGDESGTNPASGYVYNNTVTDAARTALEFYGEWDATLTTWANTFTGVEITNYDVLLGSQWNTNNDTISGDVETAVSAAEWNVFNSFTAGQCTGSTAHINFVGSWAGYNGNNDTPSAPTNVKEIT